MLRGYQTRYSGSVKRINSVELKDICYAVRQKMKLSQRELAMIIGSTQTEISFIEKGFIPPSSEKVYKIIQLAKECNANESKAT